MSHRLATLGDTVYLWFAANDTNGSGNDGATPVYDVRLGGAAANAAPVLSGAASLLSHANYPAGAHEVAIAATVGNGFALGETYAVFCALTADGQNPTGFVGSFTLGSGGSGANTVTSTIDDGSNPLESASVRYSKGAESYVQQTNASGQCTHSLDNGTWTVAITLAGYAFTQTTLVVDGNKTPTHSMSLLTITPSADPAATTVYWVVKGKDRTTVGAGQARMDLRILTPPTDNGFAWSDQEDDSAVSDANGICQFLNVPKGSTVQARLGEGSWQITEIPLAAGATYPAGEVIGKV